MLITYHRGPSAPASQSDWSIRRRDWYLELVGTDRLDGAQSLRLLLTPLEAESLGNHLIETARQAATDCPDEALGFALAKVVAGLEAIAARLRECCDHHARTIPIRGEPEPRRGA
jgi:hypothetical protein